MRSIKLIVATLLGLAFVGVAGPASAQMIHGKLLQEGTQLPLSGASIQLLDARGEELNRIVVSNTAGTFALRVEPGRYSLRIRRIGFNPLITPVITLAANEVFEGTFRVSPVAVRLATQRITEKRNLEWGRDGFARRKALNLGGLFLARSELADRDPTIFATLMRGLDGIHVDGGSKITSTEGWRCLYFMVNKIPVSSVPFGVPGSTMYPTLEDLVPTGQDVMAIEVYREFKEVPPEMKLDAWPASAAGVSTERARPNVGIGGRASSEHPCGLVSVWTRAAW